MEGVLYAMGGNDGSSSLNSVEVFIQRFKDMMFHKIFQRYDAQSNKWLLVTSMGTRRSSVRQFSLHRHCHHHSAQAGLQPPGLMPHRLAHKLCIGKRRPKLSEWIVLHINFVAIQFLSHTRSVPINQHHQHK